MSHPYQKSKLAELIEKGTPRPALVRIFGAEHLENRGVTLIRSKPKLAPQVKIEANNEVSKEVSSKEFNWKKGSYKPS